MKREELIERIKEFNKRYPNPPENWDANGTAESTADFVADVLAEREVESVSLPKYQMESISEGLRISMNYFHSKNKATALDRILCRNADYIAEAMDGTKQENNEPGKND